MKSNEAYKTIGEIAKELNLVNKKTGSLQTYTIRFWETQFKQIKPVVRAGNRRYYSEKDFNIIKFIKFLLKEKGLTINGARKILNNPDSPLLDDNTNLGVYKHDLQTNKKIKDRIKKISKIISELKKIK